MMEFEVDVIERSKEIPVLVDFWAPWCGPCKFLGPVLDELEKEANGKWELVKVNTDEHQELGALYNIRSIPAVKLFSQGAVVAEFAGALPKHQIEQWLEEHIPDENKTQFTELKKRYEAGDLNGLTEELRTFIEKAPEITDARILLARLIAFQDPEAAADLLKDVAMGNKGFDTAENIRQVARLVGLGNLSDKPVELHLTAAARSIKEEDLDTALGALIQAVMIDKSYADELPRKCVVALFDILGEKHELTTKYRRQFSMALY